MAPNLLLPAPLDAPREPIALDGSDSVLEPFPADEARALAEVFAGILPWSRYPFSPASLEKYLSANEAGAPRYLLRVGGVAAGALGLRLHWLRGPYIQFLGITPRFQRAGLGGLVLTRVIDDARTDRERNIFVATSRFNAEALRFYGRHGFVPCAQLDGLVQDDIDEVLLRKRL